MLSNKSNQKQNKPKANNQLRFEAIGTAWECDFFEFLSVEKVALLQKKMFARIEEFDAVYSRFRSDSLVSRISHQAGRYAFPEDAKQLFAVYRALYGVTDGMFTPLVGSLMEEIGYDASYSLQPKKQFSTLPDWDEVLSFTDTKLMTTKPVLLDFGAGGKGYLVDLLAELLQQEGIRAYCLDGGGDLLYRATTNQTLRVGLEHPQNPQQIIGVAEIHNQSICGSAGNRRAWRDYHHLMNPKTLQPADQYLASWVVADSGLVADSLATAIMFMDDEMLKQVQHDTLGGKKFEYLLLLPEFTIKKSDNFPAELYFQH